MVKVGLVISVVLIANFVPSNIVVPDDAASLCILVFLLISSMEKATDVQQGVRVLFARRLPKDPSHREEPDQASLTC